MPEQPTPLRAPASRVPIAGAWRPVLVSVAFAVTAAVAVRALAPAEGLAAGTTGDNTLDSDGDGLPDVFELVHGLDPFSADTDGDGYPDAVEIALGSNPKDFTSRPGQVDYSVGLLPLEDNGTFRLAQFVYAPGGHVGALNYGVFLYSQGQVVQIPTAVLTANASLTAISGGIGTDTVFVLTSAFPADLLKQLGPLTLIAATTTSAKTKWISAAGVTLKPLDGVLHQVQTTAQAAVPQLGPGSIYVPLVPQEQLPGTFTPGQICVQATEPVGSVGPMVVHQVQYSSCEDADGYCSGPSCSAQTGTTYELLDPLVLIGG